MPASVPASASVSVPWQCLCLCHGLFPGPGVVQWPRRQSRWPAVYLLGVCEYLLPSACVDTMIRRRRSGSTVTPVTRDDESDRARPLLLRPRLRRMLGRLPPSAPTSRLQAATHWHSHDSEAPTNSAAVPAAGRCSLVRGGPACHESRARGHRPRPGRIIRVSPEPRPPRSGVALGQLAHHTREDQPPPATDSLADSQIPGRRSARDHPPWGGRSRKNLRADANVFEKFNTIN